MFALKSLALMAFALKSGTPSRHDFDLYYVDNSRYIPWPNYEI